MKYFEIGSEKTRIGGPNVEKLLKLVSREEGCPIEVHAGMNDIIIHCDSEDLISTIRKIFFYELKCGRKIHSHWDFANEIKRIVSKSFVC